MIYKFVKHDVPPYDPNHRMFALYNRLKNGETPTRDEKDYIADKLYGLFSNNRSSYKFMGYCAPFYEVLPRILVKIRHIGWEEFHAPDKTSLRKALGSHTVIEM